MSRRTVVASAAGAFVMAAAEPRLAGAQLRRTSLQTIGPFYPVARPLDQDTDLTRLRGSSSLARGEAINVVGQVVDPAGRPVQHASVDVWQANAAGRYAHPADTSEAPLDPNFQGSTKIRTDEEGRFRFRTIKPGPYGSRTPHIHFDVIGRSQRTITQMYFPGEPLNGQDELLLELSPESQATLIARAIASLGDDPNSRAFFWPIVLTSG